MNPLRIYQPQALSSNDPPDLASLGYRFLAEGDSWFTIGALNPAKNSNLLFELAFGQSAAAVSCAYPGDTLRRMSAMSADPAFEQLLCGALAWPWDGILLSAGGNDLIDALQVGAAGVPPAQRLLLQAAEWGDAAQGAARYVSSAGWQTFAGYVQANLQHLLRLRDSGPAAGAPVFMHTYAVPTPRPAGAGLGAGPWLHPALQAYAIPEADRVALAAHLIGRLRDLLLACAADAARFPALHVFDSTAVAVVPAAPGTTGESGDWVNEIHLGWRGYEKIAVPWARQIEQVIAQRRGG
ncbi:MAG: hypothetical protein U1F56_02850 [Rubrivivax sp.]